MSLPWNSDLEMGILELDAQQQEMFSKFEVFSEEVERGQYEVTKFIGYLDQYVLEHFRYEEHLQERSKFPERAEHFAAHRRFADELEGLKAALQSGEETQAVSFALKGMMIRWVITHSRNTDLVFNNYLVAASEKAKQEFASKKLGDILVQSQVISAATLQRALDKQQETGGQLGNTLMEMGLITEEQIKAALMAQEGKSLFTDKLGHILVESGVISYETLERALESQKLSGKLLGTVLMEMGVIDLQEVMYAQAVQKGMLQKNSV